MQQDEILKAKGHYFAAFGTTQVTENFEGSARSVLVSPKNISSLPTGQPSGKMNS
jgi:hypothetical protein